MTDCEAKELIYVCPYHGRRSRYDRTPEGKCLRCVKQNGVTTRLRREPYKGHAPRWTYDCARCKFAWCCGPQCACHIKGKMPKRRRTETNRAARMFQNRSKVPMTDKKPVWKRRRMGDTYEWMLTGQHPKLVTGLAHRQTTFEKKSAFELRLILDPRTGKEWTSMKAIREWLDGAMKGG